MFECILKEPEEVKKPDTPSAPAKKPEVPKKGTLYFLLFDVLRLSLPGLTATWLLTSYCPSGLDSTVRALSV